ncbi:MAG TPA: hypothetical protein VFH04_03445 [Nitrososphaeraceae archaeon]|nr:hypothetical protein [Nitrososphaeraceae archaeon]
MKAAVIPKAGGKWEVREVPTGRECPFVYKVPSDWALKVGK